VGLVLFDLSSIFDMVDASILVKKLKIYGVGESACTLQCPAKGGPSASNPRLCVQSFYIYAGRVLGRDRAGKRF
jgi:hypothetical protein